VRKSCCAFPKTFLSVRPTVIMSVCPRRHENVSTGTSRQMRHFYWYVPTDMRTFLSAHPHRYENIFIGTFPQMWEHFYRHFHADMRKFLSVKFLQKLGQFIRRFPQTAWEYFRHGPNRRIGRTASQLVISCLSVFLALKVEGLYPITFNELNIYNHTIHSRWSEYCAQQRNLVMLLSIVSRTSF
jgi:hypothetical protein